MADRVGGDTAWSHRAREACAILAGAERLYTLAEMDAALSAMAQRLNDLFCTRPPCVILCAMTGAVVMTGRLLPLLEFEFELGYLHLTRYGTATSGGQVEQLAVPTVALQDRAVILLDDILDKGGTLAAMCTTCFAAGAAELFSAVLIEKDCARDTAVVADLTMLRVPDRYVFGYGLDYKGFLRNAPGLFAVAMDSAS